MLVTKIGGSQEYIIWTLEDSNDPTKSKESQMISQGSWPLDSINRTNVVH